MRGFYVSPDGTQGFLSGFLSGNQAELYSGEDEDDFGLWWLNGSVAATRMDKADNDFEDIDELFDFEDFFKEFGEAFSVVSFENSRGSLDVATVFFTVNNDEDEGDSGDWGIWLSALSGKFDQLSDGALRLAAGGTVSEEPGSNRATHYLAPLRA